MAQSGLRQSLERLDRNENGEIEPEEITALARPYLERIAEARRMSLDRSYSIERYQEAARIYHALQNGIRGERVRPQNTSSVKDFGPDDEDELIPDFGAAVIKFRYTQDDLEEAERTLRRYDRDDNGAIDWREARRAEWTHRDPFEMDLNNDGMLNQTELAQRYARRRMMSGDSRELIQKSRRTGNGIQRFERNEEDRDRGSSSWWRSGGSSYWLTASLMGRFDANRNGRLETEESAKLGLPAGQIDLDRDGEITREELFGYLSDLQEEAGDATSPLPGWFYERDADRDGQVSMGEFSEEWTDATLAEFARLDLNEDGLLTSSEVAKSSAMVGGTFTNTTAEILPPRKTVISELEVDEDVMVADLNLQVEITHTSTSQLDAYLTGPDGQRIELFAGVGGSGDHFSDTTFDDQASTPIMKGRSPFEGSFLTSSAVKKQPSLSHYNGKSAKGVWQLIIRGTRSDRFGMLHSWSLKIRPSDQLIDESFSSLDTPVAALETRGSPAPTESDRESRERKYAAYSKGSSDGEVGGLTIAEQKQRWYEQQQESGASKGKAGWDKDSKLARKEAKQADSRGKGKNVDWSKLTPEQAARYKTYLQSRQEKRKKQE
ncbi:MAG: proprotein convertase P-domain-containing protein [Aureliella sp.]